ncbi:MAG: M15 family metallopeptidase [Ilumatobacteraceae bacterium]
MPLPPITGVEARIGAILQRFTPGRVNDMTSSFDQSALLERAVPTDPSFEPFGAAYQLAVQQAQANIARFGTGMGGDSFQLTSNDSYIATGLPGASIGKIGGYGPMPVPERLAAYGNGTIPPGVLEPVGQGGHKLYGPAAEGWKQAVIDAKADGIDLRLTDSYRSYDEQVDLVSRKGLYADGGYAAVPGTSNHGWGLAVDVDVTDAATATWMRANAYRYGFVEAVPREPWHWEYRPTQA